MFIVRFNFVSGFCPEQNPESKVIPGQILSGKSRVYNVAY
jgi:hypothetical protein